MFLILLSALPDEQHSWVEKTFREERTYFFRVAHQILSDRDTAEDAVSAAFEMIIKKIDLIWKIPCPQRLPYCVSIVRRCAIDLLRRRKELASFEELPEELSADPSSETEDVALDGLQKEELMKQIASLSEEERTLLHLRYAVELPFGRIAQMLHCSEESAKKRGQRVIRKLREMMSDE